MKNLTIKAKVSVNGRSATNAEFRIHDGRLFWHGAPKSFSQPEYDNYVWHTNACLGEATVLSNETITEYLTRYLNGTPFEVTEFGELTEVNERAPRAKKEKPVEPQAKVEEETTEDEPTETIEEVKEEETTEKVDEPQPVVVHHPQIRKEEAKDEDDEDVEKAVRLLLAATRKPQKQVLDVDEITAIIDERVKALASGLLVKHEYEFKHEDGQTIKVEGRMCAEFESMCETVRCGFPVYMTGPAGTGKSYTAKKIAEALGLDYYESMQVMFAHDVKGYGDANGNYQETPFFKAFTKGGVFFLDEVDASAPEALVVLNTAIANGRFDFPIVGNVQAHPNFRVIAAGNTGMTGADTEYTGRQVIDASTINRFFFVPMNYDHDIQTQIAGGDEEISNYLDDLRRAAEETHISLTVSYRQAETLGNKTLQKAWTDEALLSNGVFKGMQKDEIRVLFGALNNKTGRWAQAHYTLF